MVTPISTYLRNTSRSNIETVAHYGPCPLCPLPVAK